MNDLQRFLQQPSSHVLVISACTAKKTYDLRDQLTAGDLDDIERRRAGEARLKQYQLPAATMYAGDGHQCVRQAINILRDHGYEVTHYILSAGYGWLDERDVIVPYNVTFAKKSTHWIRERGERLNLRNRLVEIANAHQRVIFILGRQYLDAIGLPLPIESLPPTLAYVAPSFTARIGKSISTISVGQSERRKIRAFSTSAKEKRFLVDVQLMLGKGVDHEQ